MGKRVFKALVIDDGAERNLTYHNVLDRIFDTEIENDISLITKKRIRKYDLLIIDVCLSVFTKELTAFKLMDDYNISTPTVLISGEWIKSNGEPNEDILMVPKHKNVIKLISWNTFVKRDNEERIAEEIYYDFCKACNISTAVRKDKCTILQLSDLQFGGNALFQARHHGLSRLRRRPADRARRGTHGERLRRPVRRRAHLPDHLAR